MRPNDLPDRIASVDSYGQAQRNTVPLTLPGTDAWSPTQEQLDAEEYAWRPPATLPPLLPVQPATPSPGASSSAGPTPTSSPSSTSNPSGGPTTTSGPSTAPTSTGASPTPTPTGTTTP
ncbi:MULTISPECIES: hypothetical protein [Arsenicicoccus]|uniref:hypothetical protein n=1 Tax=Arsenicicoccus TaxID=267408 RepID=UPI0025810862|nr:MULTISPECIES: hypothetical protein [Arsenicicoccus]